MTTEAISETNLGELLLTYGKAWNDHDADAIAALHTEDTRFCTHGVSETVKGRAAMRTAAAETFERLPEFASEARKVLFGDDHWVLEWTLVNGDLRVDCVDIITIEAGLVKTKDTYFDVEQLRIGLAE